MNTIDFDALIRQAMENGMNATEIADAMSSSLTRMEKESPANKRKKVVKELTNEFWNHAADDDVAAKDIGYLAVSIFESARPDWSAETIEKFAKSVTEYAELQSRILHDDPKKIMNALGKEIGKTIEEAATRVKTEAAARFPDRKIEPYTLNITDEDMEAIKKFLEDMRF